MSTSGPPPTTWTVTRINEDAREVAITLTRTTWLRDEGSDNNADAVPAQPGEPGSFWSKDGATTVITLDPAQAMYFDVGRQYVMALTEIVDAPAENVQA